MQPVLQIHNYTSTLKIPGQKQIFEIARQGILKPVQPDGVTNTSLVVWQWNKYRASRLCMDLKFQNTADVMDEDYRIPDMKTTFHNVQALAGFPTLKTIYCFRKRRKNNFRNEHLQSKVYYVSNISSTANRYPTQNSLKR